MGLGSQASVKVWAFRSLALMGVCVLATSSWLALNWRSASGQVCIEPAGASLTLLEMGELRKTLRRHQSERTRPMRLTQDQMTFVLVDHLEYPVSFRLFGERVEVFASIPTSRGCVHLNYIGGLSVEGGDVSLRSQAVRVGGVAVPGVLVDWLWLRASLSSLAASPDPFLKAVDRVVLHDAEAQIWLNTSERLW